MKQFSFTLMLVAGAVLFTGALAQMAAAERPESAQNQYAAPQDSNVRSLQAIARAE